MIPNSWKLVKSVVAQVDPNARRPGESIDAWFRRTSGGTATTDPYRESREQRAAAAAATAAAAAERAARGERTLSQLDGGIFINPDTGEVVQLFSQLVGGTRQWRTIDSQGRRSPVTKGLRLVDDFGTAYTIGDLFGGRADRDFNVFTNELSEGQFNDLLGRFGGGAGVGSADAAQHGYDVELERIRQAHDAEQRRLDREAQAELARIQEENAMKRARLGEAGSLARTAAEVQQRARQLIAELTGVDPIRGAIAAQGGVQRGATPAQAFTSQLQGIANAPIPQVSESAPIPEIEQTIQSLQDQQQLPTMPALGFAAGGTIDMAPTPSGRFAAVPPVSGMPDMGVGAEGVGPMPGDLPAGALGMGPASTMGAEGEPAAELGTTKRAILVGEKGGFTGDEEVIVLDTANPGRVEVIPLMTGAQTGGTFDPNTIRGALSSIYGSLGFKGLPVAHNYGSAGGYNFESPLQGTSLETSRRLGLNPRLIRDVSTGTVYFKNPQGVLQGIASADVFNQAGFRWEDVLNASPNELSQFGRLGTLAEGLTSPPGLIEGPVRPGTARSLPLVEKSTGIPLPPPEMLSGVWRYLDPQTRQVLLSAYGASGLGAGPSGSPTENARLQLEEAFGRATPTGTQRRARTARFS